MKCACCDRTDDLAGVACSALGAISFQYCRSCAENGAEPEWLIQNTIDDLGGINQIRPELLEGVTYFRHGRYIKMSQYSSTLPRGKS